MIYNRKFNPSSATLALKSATTERSRPQKGSANIGSIAILARRIHPIFNNSAKKMPILTKFAHFSTLSHFINSLIIRDP